MGIPIAAGVAVGRAIVGHFQRKSNPGVYTLGNQKYLQNVAKGTAQITDAWLNNRAAQDLPKLEKLLQKQPGASGPLPSTADVLSSSPTMPGGGWATPDGVQPASSRLPPLWFGGNAPAGGTRKSSKRRKGSSSKRKASSSKRRKASRSKRRGGKKLAFGSPAWRKKYLKKKA